MELQTDADDVPVLLQPPPTAAAAAAADSRAAGLAPPVVPAVRMFVDAVSMGPLPEVLQREGGLMVRLKVRNRTCTATYIFQGLPILVRGTLCLHDKRTYIINVRE